MSLTLNIRKYTLWHWLIPAMLLVILRANIPALPGETNFIHNTIVNSILDGNKWGLLALVKIPDVPLIPTISLLAARWFLDPLDISAAPCICAISQTIVLLMLIHAIPQKESWGFYAAMILFALPAVPLFKNLMMVNDPNWISAIPLTSAILQMRNSGDKPSLKTVCNIALCIGLMVFCGPVMLAVAIALLVVFAVKAAKSQAPAGTLCILLMPAVYGMLLWFPWYSPTEDNILTETFVAFNKMDSHVFASPFDLRFFILLCVTVSLLLVSRHQRMLAACLLPTCILIPATAATTNYLGLTPAGAAPCITVITAIVFITAYDELTARTRTLPAIAALAFIAAMTCACIYPEVTPFYRATPDVIARNTPEPPDIFDFDDAPTVEKLSALADEQWDGSHIIIVGKRLIRTVYPDPTQIRFKPMMEFSPDRFRQLAATEQLHLLVPPNDGRFYQQDSPLAAIHADGAPYLFPVAQLANGWQLWRSIPAPPPHQPTPWHKPH